MAVNPGARRIIYAKLTSTGAYDVVAKTANIDLPAAREIAELLQLGNLPFGVRIGEELGYARPAAGGHVIARYTTYGWNDGRPAPPMTDLIWVDDASFERVRRNPFALVPVSDAVFAELTELPPVDVPSVDAQAELVRIRSLAPSAADFTGFVAGVLAAESLLLVNPQSQRANLELLMLVLPPPLRERLTFQTCAWQPPQLRRRVTIADAIHANLRQAAWSRVLPDDADALTLNPAHRFTEFLSAPDRLQRAHVLYERQGDGKSGGEGEVGDLATEAARVVRMADFIGLLDRKLITEALRLLGRAGHAEAAIELAEVESRFPVNAITEALVAIFESASDENALVRALQAAHGPGSVHYHDVLGNAVLGGRHEPTPELCLLLLRREAVSGDADRALRLHALLRTGGADFETTDLPGPIARYIEAQTPGRLRGIPAATATLKAAAELYERLKTREARKQVEQQCIAATDRALHGISLTVADVRELCTLQDAATAIDHEWSQRLHEAVLCEAYIRKVKPADLKQNTGRIATTATGDTVGALCASLLVGIAEATEGELRNRLAAAAQALLTAHPDRRLGVRVAALLEPLGVRDSDLLEQPAFAAVLPLLGDTAREASLAQSLGHALARLYTDGSGATAELATAVFSARASQQSIEPGSRALATVIRELHSAHERGLVAQHPTQTELALDLLAFAAEPAAIRQIENAALGKSDGIGIRLRRLDRAIAQSCTAQDEQLYSALADALESNQGGIDAATRQRLRNALGTAGMHRRVLEAFNSVVQRSSP